MRWKNAAAAFAIFSAGIAMPRLLAGYGKRISGFEMREKR